MKKYLILFLPILLTGCIGRTVHYDQSPSQGYDKKSINKTYKPSFNSSSSTSYKGFILKHNPSLDSIMAENIAHYVSQYSKENDVDPKLILALMSRESSFRANAISSTGAIGLGQLLKATAKDMGVENPLDPEENTKATVKYLSMLIKKWKGNTGLALASYKIGHFTVSNLIKSGKSLPKTTQKYINEIKYSQTKISDNIY